MVPKQWYAKKIPQNSIPITQAATSGFLVGVTGIMGNNHAIENCSQHAWRRSQLAAIVLRSIFKHDFVDPSVGFQLKAKDGTLHRLRFELGAFCQDAQAHKMLFSVKGDGGTRYCA